jgi:hypothetical protein
MPWHVTQVDYAVSEYYSNRGDFDKVIYLGETEAVLPVEFDNEESGVVKLNQNGKELWQAKFKGTVLGTGLMNGNIILVYAEYDRNFLRKVHAATIDNATGKTMQDKVVYEIEQKLVSEVKILNTASSEIHGILIRISNDEGKRGNTDKQKAANLSTSKLLLVELNKELSPNITEVKAAGQTGAFLGAIAGKNNDFFFCSVIGGLMVAEQFNNKGVFIAKLQSPLSKRNDYQLPVISVDSKNALMVGVHYENTDKDLVTQVYYFDFASKKVLKTLEEKLDKSYARALEPLSIKKMQNGDLRQIERLHIVGVLPSTDKFAVIKEIQFLDISNIGNGGAVRHRNDAVVVSIYDQQWKLLKTLALDKKYEAFINLGRSLGMKVLGDKLYLVMPSLNAPASYSTLLATVNLNTLQVESFTELDKKNIGKSESVEAGATLWFPNAMLLEYFIPKGGLRIKNINSIWQKVELN